MLNIEMAVPAAAATKRPLGENIADITGAPSEAIAAAPVGSPGSKNAQSMVARSDS
jgi:hypothetical protein